MRLVLAVALVLVVSAVLLGTARSQSRVTTCTAASTKAAVRAFVASLNEGDFAALQSMFAREPAFQWYSSNAPGARVQAASKYRPSLIRYFRVRHAKRDRLRVVSVRFTGNRQGWDAVPAHGNFSAVLKRSAEDFRSGAWFRLISKGALVCWAEPSAPAQFIVFSFGGPGSARG